MKKWTRIYTRLEILESIQLRVTALDKAVPRHLVSAWSVARTTADPCKDGGTVRYVLTLLYVPLNTRTCNNAA